MKILTQTNNLAPVKSKPANAQARPSKLQPKADTVQFKGNREAINLVFKKLAKEVPAHKLAHVEKLQTLFDKLPATEAVADLAECGLKAAKGDYAGMSISAVGLALDHTVLAPVKWGFISAAGGKGTLVGGGFFGPVGALIGGGAAAVTAHQGWNAIRNGIIKGIVNLSD